MGKIHKLPESLIRLIAAGEVVERPASVVKELVENSLDAGATHVRLELENAGRTRIRVTDNGHGMTKDDALLALDRHATSKLQTFEDLHALSTFGFRGEALPSIAAVSRLTLSTRTADAAEGWAFTLEGGTLQSTKAVGIPPGTTIDVQDLFFNTPARAKFLKKDPTERAQVLKTVQEIALAHPSIRFDLSMDGKSILALASAPDLSVRLGDLWSMRAGKELVALQVKRGPCTVRGFVNAIAHHHPTRAYQILYINQRPVQQRLLTHAITEAYREWLPVGRHPVYCLFVDLDPSLVDVNVHPTKREVRISEERALYDVLYSAVRDLFREPAPAMEYQPSSSEPWNSQRISTLSQGAGYSAPFLSSASNAGASLVAERIAAVHLQAPLPQMETSTALPGAGRYLGQFQKLYLLFEQGEDLVLVDQHAAAERVLYERLLAQVSRLQVERQALLTPLVWDVSPDQADTVESFLPDLESMGFILEPIGPHSFALKEWPAVLPETRLAKRFLEEVLEDFQQDRPTSRTDVQHQIAARAACRAAVMANDHLEPAEVTQLMNDLAACERPMTCPHGRPTQIRIPQTDLHKRFRRI